MFCPIDGDEFLEGVTRCPEHDVELVEDPPELSERLSWVERFNDRVAVRFAFVIFLVSAVTYGISGAAAGIVYLLLDANNFGEDAFNTVNRLQQVQSLAFPLAIASLGVLLGALVLRTYLGHSAGTSERNETATDAPEPAAGPIPQAVMRLLFALTVVFALLWAGTDIATSREQIRSGPAFGFGRDQKSPDDSYVALVSLNLVAYVCGVSSLAIMGAGLMARAYDRGRRLDP
jgi:hypothetical protein